MVFTPLSLDFLRALGRGAGDASHNELLYELYYRRIESPDTARAEPIVLSTILPDAVNANMGARSRVLVDRVNGTRIDKLEDVIRAFETNTNAYHVLQFMPNHLVECLDRAATAKANAAILQNYAVTKDRRL